MEISPNSVPNATLLFPTVPVDGGSQPRFRDFDDMVLRLVKWQPSNHGLTTTYSELAASRIGQLIEAPVIRGSVVYVDMNLLPPEVSGRISQPFHLGFTYSPGSNFLEHDYASIDNSAALPAAAVHLAWLQVGDQEEHNQYLYQLERVLPDRTTRKMNSFVLVDQVFICGSPDWSTMSLDNPDSPYALPSHLQSRITMTSIDSLLDRVNSLDDMTIRACFESYPESWGIRAELVEKVTSYILRRRSSLYDILRANLV